jgi:hypothetical protein
MMFFKLEIGILRWGNLSNCNCSKLLASTTSSAD